MKLTINPFDKQRPLVLTLSSKPMPPRQTGIPVRVRPFTDLPAAADEAASGLAESLFMLSWEVPAGEYRPAALE
jgi:hypothetical protein